MPIITVKNLSKRYNINRPAGGYVALRDVIAKAGRNPLSFLWGKGKELAGMNKKEEFWALRDVNFEVEKGDVVGIIGANGAGKSTLLKILSQITPPTEGEIVLNGKVGSLLEVGTGFHPELSGRENAFLNGAILGMAKEEIEAKFDQIVEFSGIGKFIDTPVKYYSSGMYVRLAFSVAAHLEPDILLVDEVLAVGDAEFQKKCLGKMDEVTKKDGRTILFVSHNMEAIKRICTKCIILEQGRVKDFGDVEKMINQYLNSDHFLQSKYIFEDDNKKKVQIKMIEVLDGKGIPNNNLDNSEGFSINVDYEIREDLDENNYVGIEIFKDNTAVLITYDVDTDENLYKSRPKGRYSANFRFPGGIFNGTGYTFNVYLGINPKYSARQNRNEFFEYKDNILLNFFNNDNFATKFFGGWRNGNFLMKIPCATKHHGD